jgi:hypothetical protein
MTIETDDKEKIITQKVEEVKKALKGVTVSDVNTIFQRVYTDLLNNAMQTKV